jgi:DNA invertase Pin-like site-specific DNA recombinase
MKSITKIEPSAARPTAAKTRVAAYCRVSTGMDDQLVSLETQKSHYKDLISSNPEWVYAGLYYDEGISGTSKEKRPALQQLIADCEQGKIDRVLTKSLSRFARNTTDCLELTRKLLDLGVTIYFEKENLDTGSMESELLLSIMSSLAESESVSLSENNKWSVRHRFENGTYTIASPPYGYDNKDGELVINEEEAEWVRWIFAQALGGKTSGWIARELNDRNLKTKKNGIWRAGTIRGMLKNEKYTGACLYQKSYTDFRFKRHKNYGEKDQFMVEDHHEPIISKEDFETVGALLKQRAQEKNIQRGDPRYQNRYPFSGKLICGECGKNFKRHVNSTGYYRYAVWVCSRHLDDKRMCSMKSVREADLEGAFTTMLNKLIFAKKEILEDLLDTLRGKAQKDSLRQIDQIDHKMELNAERKKTLTTLMTRGYLEPAIFTQENNEIAAEADALLSEKERLVKEVAGNMHQTDSLNDLIQYVAHAKPGTSFDGDLVGRFVDHVTIRTRTEIVFHLKCGLNLTERIGDK